MAAETTSRVSSSLTNRAPSLFTKMAPLPRTPSVYMVWVSGFTVGCVWICSRSTKAAPRCPAMAMPSPVAPAWLVVPKPARPGWYSVTISALAPKPPVASTTALAWIR